ncbi:MAG: FecCD family ABC transporter permease [Acidimicrobiia bacterium]
MTIERVLSTGNAPAPRVAVRLGLLSFRLAPCTVALATGFTGAVLALYLWSLNLGEFPVSLDEVIRSALGVGSGEFDFVVRTLRMPRATAAMLVGLAWGCSGAIFQGLVRNPLVSPDIIGVSNGASLAAVTLIVTGASTRLVPVAALAGALATAFVIYLLTWKGGIHGSRLVLVGIGVNAILGAGTTFMIVRFPVERVTPAVLWMTGTLYGRGWEQVAAIAAGGLMLVPAALALSRRLGLLQLGDHAAAALGAPVQVDRSLLLVVGAFLAGLAVAVAGPLGFVALMVPHLGRMLAGPITAGVLVLSGLLGATLVLASDIVAQHAFPISLPVGLVTAAVGAPYFLFLLWRTNRIGGSA